MDWTPINTNPSQFRSDAVGPLVQDLLMGTSPHEYSNSLLERSPRNGTARNTSANEIPSQAGSRRYTDRERVARSPRRDTERRNQRRPRTDHVATDELFQQFAPPRSPPGASSASRSTAADPSGCTRAGRRRHRPRRPLGWRRFRRSNTRRAPSVRRRRSRPFVLRASTCSSIRLACSRKRRCPFPRDAGRGSAL